MREELKPCRCCGKPPNVNIRYTSVWCITPRDECPYSKLAMSPDEWNTRPIEDAALARAEKAAAELEQVKAERDWLALQLQRAYNGCPTRAAEKEWWLEWAAQEVAKRGEKV